jgi:DNA polymerase-3 subunit delta
MATMKIKAAEADAFVRNPDPNLRAVLVYGPDAGLVRERAAALVKAVAEDPSDPFRLADIQAARLADDPALLADEAAAISFSGGRRAVRVPETSDSLAPVFESFLATVQGDALVVAEAGDLSARSALRKLFEGAKNAAALPCYRDDARDLPKVIAAMLREAGLSAAPEALAYLTAHLGGDRQLTRREIEKLILYKGSGDARVELEDAEACVGDSAELTLEDIAYAVGDGDLKALERAYQRALLEGNSPVRALGAAAQHLQRLQLAAALAGSGNLDQVMKTKLRPPVFWKLAGRFRQQVGRWTGTPHARQRLADALARLLEVDYACRQTGAPAETLAGRALLEVAARAPRQGRAAQPGRS